MRLQTAAPAPLPRQCRPLAPNQHIPPQHHRSSEGALTYSGAALLGATSHHHNTRLSLDTKAEYYLNQLRRTSQFEPTRSSSILGTVWASYFFIFVAICLTFSIVFAVGFYINSMTAKKVPSDMSTALSVKRILGTKLFDREEKDQENGAEDSPLLMVEKLRKTLHKPRSKPESKEKSVENLDIGEEKQLADFVASDMKQRAVLNYY